jgi:hypothetical protein
LVLIELSPHVHILIFMSSRRPSTFSQVPFDMVRAQTQARARMRTSAPNPPPASSPIARSVAYPPPRTPPPPPAANRVLLAALDAALRVIEEQQSLLAEAEDRVAQLTADRDLMIASIRSTSRFLQSEAMCHVPPPP